MNNETYRIYKGLQKPNVMLGLKGPNITWALGMAVAVLVTVLIFFFLNLGLLAGIGAALIPLGYGGYKIKYKMDHGLYDKKKHTGVLIVKNLTTKM